jgi:hypothetical protein
MDWLRRGASASARGEEGKKEAAKAQRSEAGCQLTRRFLVKPAQRFSLRIPVLAAPVAISALLFPLRRITGVIHCYLLGIVLNRHRPETVWVWDGDDRLSFLKKIPNHSVGTWRYRPTAMLDPVRLLSGLPIIGVP